MNLVRQSFPSVINGCSFRNKKTYIQTCPHKIKMIQIMSNYFYYIILFFNVIIKTFIINNNFFIKYFTFLSYNLFQKFIIYII